MCRASATAGGLRPGPRCRLSNSLRVEFPIERRYLEPQGLQDAAYDLLTADMSTMSSTYVTIMSASVTVGETGDAVTVHVTGKIGRMGGAFYLANQALSSADLDELWRIDDPTAPGSAALEGDFPAALAIPRGITSQGVVALRGGFWNARWIIADRRSRQSPGSAVREGSFPSGLTNPSGITSQGGSLYVVDSGHAR